MPPENDVQKTGAESAYEAVKNGQSPFPSGPINFTAGDTSADDLEIVIDDPDFQPEKEHDHEDAESRQESVSDRRGTEGEERQRQAAEDSDEELEFESFDGDEETTLIDDEDEDEYEDDEEDVDEDDSALDASSDADAGEESDAGPDPDDRPESRAVRNRIMRLERLRKKAEREHAQQVQGYKRDLEVAYWDKTLTQRHGLFSAKETAELHLREAREQLIRAREDGDYRAEGQIEERLRKVYAVMDQVDTALSRIPEDDKILAHIKGLQDGSVQPTIELPQNQQQGQQPDASDTNVTDTQGDGAQDADWFPPEPQTEMAEKWQSHNPWMDDLSGDMKEAQQYAILVGRQLGSEGFDPNKREYYSELTKRLRRVKKFEKLDIRGVDGKKAGGKRRRKARRGSPVGSGKTTQAATNSNRRVVSITDNDREVAKALRIDLTNKDQKNALLRAKRNRVIRESRGGFRS